MKQLTPAQTKWALDKLREIVAAAGGQVKAANKLGMHGPMISNYLSGKRQMGVVVAERIAKHLGEKLPKDSSKPSQKAQAAPRPQRSGMSGGELLQFLRDNGAPELAAKVEQHVRMLEEKIRRVTVDVLAARK